MGLFGLGDDTDTSGGDSSGGFLMPMAAQAMQADPRSAIIQSIMQTGQQQLQQPTYSRTAALAKALIMGIGGASSGYLQSQYADAAKGAGPEIQAAVAATKNGGDGLSMLTSSKNPMARYMGYQLLGPALAKRFDPVVLSTGQQQFMPGSTTPLTSNTAPLTDVGKLIAARDALPQGDPNRAAYGAQIQKLNSEGGVQFTGDGAAAVPGFGPAKAQIAGQVAGSEAQAQLGPGIVKEAASYGLRPVPLGPTESLQSGFNALPPQLQNAISTAVNTLPAVHAAQAQAQPPLPYTAPPAPSPAPASPRAQATTPPPQPVGTGGVPAAMTPLQYKSQEERGAALEKYGEGLDTNSSSAVQSNFLLDQMRSEGQGFNQGKFADMAGDARSVLDGFRSTFFPDAPPSQPLADWQTFDKNAMQITMQAVHATSSRAAAQEFQMIQHALPSSQMSQGGFNQIANQLEAVNDFHIAKQAATQEWRQTHGQTLDGFESNWNAHVTPGAFLINRLAPADLQSLYDRLNQTDSGKLIAKSLSAHAQWAAQNGLFGGGAQ